MCRLRLFHVRAHTQHGHARPHVPADEVSQSDKDPLSYVITEQYRSKADYLGAHR